MTITSPIAVPETEDPPGPITERTRAIQELSASLQDVSKAVEEIREMLKKRETKAEQIMSALKRAVNQFLAQI